MRRRNLRRGKNERNRSLQLRLSSAVSFASSTRANPRSRRYLPAGLCHNCGSCFLDEEKGSGEAKCDVFRARGERGTKETLDGRKKEKLAC